MPELPSSDLRPWLRASFCILAGLAIGAGYAPMLWWPLALLGVAGFTYLMVGLRPRSAFGYGYLVGLAMNTVTIHWVSVLGSWVAAALILFMSLWIGLLGVMISVLGARKFWWATIPCAWILIELAAGSVPFGGFPWLRLAYTTVDAPIAGWLPVLGATGVSFLIAVTAQLLLAGVLCWRSARRTSYYVVAGALSISLLGLLVGLIPTSPKPAEEITIGLVQGNVNRLEKGTGTYARSVTGNHLSETIFLLARNRATAEQPLDFVLWAENATDIDPAIDEDTKQTIESAAHLAGVPIFVGAVTQGPVENSRQTTGIWWDPETGAGDTYMKRNLVPFGEWIPMRDFFLPLFPILEQVGAQSIPGTEPGVLDAPTARFPGLVVGDIICFELAWDETVYDTVRGGAELIVTQSNTNTYAGTFEPHQQMTINRVRAMEVGREMVASTLNGISGLITVDGEVIDPTSELTAANRTYSVGLRYNTTLAVRLSPWLGYLISLAAVGALVWAVLARRREAANSK